MVSPQICLYLSFTPSLTLTKSSKILQGAFLEIKTALLETGTFTSSNEAKLHPGQEVQAISAEYEDKSMFPKVHWRILEDFEGFRKVPARIPRGLG